MPGKRKPYVITRGKIIFDISGNYCDSPASLLRSDIFMEILTHFIERLSIKETTIYGRIKSNVPPKKQANMAGFIAGLFRLLVSHTAAEIAALSNIYNKVLSEKNSILEFIEELYNYWRHFERFLYMEAPKRSRYATSSIHHSQFIKTNTELKNLVLDTYRQVRENLIGKNPRSYRQLPAGANMGMLLEKIQWDCPELYLSVKDIPFIRLTIMESPLILYPKANTRKGSFEEIKKLTEDMMLLVNEQWFCYPAKVGPLTAFIYFHQDFISQALSLCNLFEISDYEDIENKRPDMILFYGLKSVDIAASTAFYEDTQNKMFVGLVQHSEDIDYFGYFKKLPLTLHNMTMLKRNRLPVHGAMVYLTLKDGSSAGIVIVGDSGAGKSETLEALRTLAEDYIRDITIVFDDMGSLALNESGALIGYGTEIGAFVRLDDLHPGYAYEEIDRSIFMNPDKINARLIIPVTTYNYITKGFGIDIVLYANNYEQVDDKIIELFSDANAALNVFRSGARFAKGTTDEKGVVNTYFANPFGAPQRRDTHEELAAFYFNKMFATGVTVGQIRTRLAIKGYAQEGPKKAALELLKFIKKT
ncbi:MAG: phosphoenolpyruvate carboxykinase [Nitrospirae bacterium]|nr:phosphoenolpyruvate carboxykinase [Nitrospirota bacterium]MBF0536364.1 phosphoenolpyruvate carboxykinase [Nitrospirota bacterium]MBF0616595.1 phosphoenolpyruvate carboxykinase [Nitrospirota bacterium]